MNELDYPAAVRLVRDLLAEQQLPARKDPTVIRDTLIMAAIALACVLMALLVAGHVIP